MPAHYGVALGHTLLRSLQTGKSTGNLRDPGIDFVRHGEKKATSREVFQNAG